ncbi:SdpI family protein [Clostridium sardiniense]|uniref:SdpI family protein n=1 Tax=Clostridium sardiniense TaxID=29369 RepID=UPI003D32A216
MGFWIFMMISDLLIPITMVGFGKYFIKHAPKEINEVFGYRTSMSMKNKDTWEFAHHYFGKLWLTIGWIMLVISAIAMLFVIGRDEDVVGTFGGILCGIQLVLLIGPIFPTERALKRNFDKRGNRKSEITKK